MAKMATKNELTKRKWYRLRGQMIEQQPSWAGHLRAIPFGSPEIKKAVDSGEIHIESNVALPS